MSHRFETGISRVQIGNAACATFCSTTGAEVTNDKTTKFQKSRRLNAK